MIEAEKKILIREPQFLPSGLPEIEKIAESGGAERARKFLERSQRIAIVTKQILKEKRVKATIALKEKHTPENIEIHANKLADKKRNEEPEKYALKPRMLYYKNYSRHKNPTVPAILAVTPAV